MSRRLVPVTLDNLSDLPVRCRSCVFWELDPAAHERVTAAGGAALEKEAWISDTLLEWGSCGLLAYVEGLPAGFVLYAPAAYVPRASAFPTSPVSPDAVLVMTARVLSDFAGRGLGRMLAQGAAREIVRRGYRALEAFGSTGLGGAADTGDDGSGGRPAAACVLPVGYLRAVGFKTVRPHPVTPRLRLDIRSTVTWREDVEAAIERLFGTLPAPVATR